MPNRRMKALTVGANTYDLVDETSGYITGMTILSYGSSSWQDFLAAYNAQKVVYCRASSQSNPASGSQTRLAFMAYVNDTTNPTSVEFQYYRSVSSKSIDQQGDQVFVYTLTSAGNWSVTTREAMAEIRAGGDLTESYSNGVLTISGTIPTVPTNVSAFTNDAGYLTSYTETDPTVPSWAKASTKPTYTASEVGAAATSHAHGNITSGGDITATAPTIANGDQIIINDSSASKITNGPTFDGSTTNKYLSPKGTWESLPQGTAYTAGTGLSLSGTEFNHSNSVTAQTTQAVYPITIDAQGHISAYGSAVDISKEIFVITITYDGSSYSFNKTFSEITTAYNEGKYIIGYDTDFYTYYYLAFVGVDYVSFSQIPAVSEPYSSESPASVTCDYLSINSSNQVDHLNQSINVPTKTSHLVNDSGFITSYTDEKLKIAAITSGTTYYPIVAANSTAAATRQYDNSGFEYYGVNGTAGDVSSNGQSRLALGNNIAHSTTKWKQGILRLYGTTTYYVDLKTASGKPAANRTIIIPDADGTLALTSDIPTKVSDLTNDSGFITDAGVTGAKGTEAISVTPPAETADGYSTGNITITHSTRAGYKHIPSGGSSGQILKYGGSSGTATWSTPSISATYDSTTKDLTLSITTS